MNANLRIARALLTSALEKEHDAEEYMLEAATLKLFAAQTAMRDSLEAIQIHGGYGYTKEYPVERFMRDNKLIEIGGGSNEMLRMILSRDALK
jgi:alkylation response protein AidB-like acyl-CoA dehydrogenase